MSRQPSPLPPKHDIIRDESRRIGITATGEVAKAIAAQAAQRQQRSSPPRRTPSDGSSASCGIGIVLRASKKTPPDPYLKIESVRQDGPACKAGVKCNDRVVSVDGADMSNAPLERVQNAIKGSPGSTVKLRVARGGQPIDFIITRGRLSVRGPGQVDKAEEFRIVCDIVPSD
jgi:C-terminal processing protease CtpA/Prc